MCLLFGALQFHRYRKPANNTHKTHVQHSMPLQHSIFNHIPVHFSKTHSPARPPSRAQQPIPAHSPNWPGAITRSATPAPVLTPCSCRCPTDNTDTRFLSSLWEANCPGVPRDLIPLLSTKRRGVVICCLSLGFPQLPAQRKPDNRHMGP